MIVVGLLAGCGGVEADVGSQGDNLEEQRRGLVPCEDLDYCSVVNSGALCISDSGLKSCTCTSRMTWDCR